MICKQNLFRVLVVVRRNDAFLKEIGFQFVDLIQRDQSIVGLADSFDFAKITGKSVCVALVVSFSLSLSPALHLIYGVLACSLIIFELRPNIERLRSGTERRVEHL